MIDNLGLAIRELRVRKKITLQELSDSTCLSISYLSLLERGQCNPTLSNVQKICDSLNITMANLLANLEDESEPILKKEDRKVLFKSNPGVTYESLTCKKPLSALLMTVHDNSLSISDTHNVDEFGYMITGSLVLKINHKEYILEPGDTVYVPANTDHSLHKLNDEDSVSLWVYGLKKK